MNTTTEVKTTEELKKERLDFHVDSIYYIIREDLIEACKVSKTLDDALSTLNDGETLEDYYYNQANVLADEAAHSEDGLLTHKEVFEEVWDMFSESDLIAEVEQAKKDLFDTI